MNYFVKRVIILQSSYMKLKHGFLPKIAGLDFPDPSNSWLVKLVEPNAFWWNPSR